MTDIVEACAVWLGIVVILGLSFLGLIYLMVLSGAVFS